MTASATVEGTIINNGTITNNGTFENNGTVKNSGSIVNNNAVTGIGKFYNQNGGTATGSGTYATAPVTIGTDFLITPTNSSDTLVYGTDYTYEGGVLKILSSRAITIANASNSSTTDTIVVEKGKDANITLAGVNIDVSGTGDPTLLTAGSAAFRIADDSTGNVIITLADGSENTLKGGNKCAGLQKNGDTNTGNLTIQGGTNGTGKLIATGGSQGAGIGDGSGGSDSDITISGGTVTAIGSKGGAGIGGGYNNSAERIKITGGSLYANGGAYNNYNGADIGNGVKYLGSGVYENGTPVIPTNGTEYVYLLAIENPDGVVVFIDGSNYTPVNHKAADGDTTLYAYLPAKTSIADPLEVKVGEKTTNYYYDTTKSTWLAIVDIPNEDTKPYTYTGSEQTYTIAESDYYTIDGNKQINAGTYDVTVALKDANNTVWSDGTTTDKTYTLTPTRT